MRNRRRRRITYRPSKGQSIFGGVVGVIFVILGLVVVIPTFGPFGILWTLIAVGITGVNLYQGFGKGYIGPEIRVEEDGEEPAPGEEPLSAEERLRQLRSLYDQRLITQEEYESKREEILKEL